MRKEFWETSIYLIHFFVAVIAMSKRVIKRQRFDGELFCTCLNFNQTEFFYSEYIIVIM